MDHRSVQNVQTPWECTARTPERLPLHKLRFLSLFHRGGNQGSEWLSLSGKVAQQLKGHAGGSEICLIPLASPSTACLLGYGHLRWGGDETAF